MANEIAYNIGLTFSKGSVRESVSASGNINVSGTKYVHTIQNIGTTAETLQLGDITSPGLCYLKNLDSTNYVEVSINGTNFVIKCKAGEPALFRVDGSAVQVKANTAACDVEYFIIED